jgi:hypothetical protein
MGIVYISVAEPEPQEAASFFLLESEPDPHKNVKKYDLCNSKKSVQ